MRTVSQSINWISRQFSDTTHRTLASQSVTPAVKPSVGRCYLVNTSRVVSLESPWVNFLYEIVSGSNGKDYTFLLKGHEDLRQDERVMQLFGLVNSLLMDNPGTARKN